jgi:hypothetical protein
MFISFSICCNHFTSLAYDIFYARKVDLFDKIKEVVVSQLFPCVQGHGSQISNCTVVYYIATSNGLTFKISTLKEQKWRKSWWITNFLRINVKYLVDFMVFQLFLVYKHWNNCSKATYVQKYRFTSFMFPIKLSHKRTLQVESLSLRESISSFAKKITI